MQQASGQHEGVLHRCAPHASAGNFAEAVPGVLSEERALLFYILFRKSLPHQLLEPRHSFQLLAEHSPGNGFPTEEPGGPAK